MTKTATPFSRPVYLMAKPAGAACNLACTYCYYLEKKHLYAGAGKQLMSDELLETFIRDYIALQTTPNVLFTWHGGEPTLRPIKFYERALELQRKYANGRHIDNAFQTNGTLINEEWARFFKKNNFLVGLSIDGPQDLHDDFRRAPSGKGSWARVMQTILTLNRHGVEWNAMAVVNNRTAEQPLDFYHFFKEIGCHYIQFTPVVERFYRHHDGRLLAAPTDGAVATMTPFSVTPEAWGHFLCEVFDEWVRHDVGDYFIQLFDSTLAGWMGMTPSVCTLAETCGHAPVMEWNGDVYACDHFVFPEFYLGNIRTTPLKELVQRPELLAFGRDKRDRLTAQCRNCDYLMACHGECPRNRFATSQDGENGHNYLCDGYHRFFSHSAPYMDFMKYMLQHNEAPAKVMEWIADGMPDYRKR
ncbi:MAG: anaerobic sulfatase-maturation protein [Alloprevotella sp.]|nr:anaerobic sulfatase-maturation protein [Alloprevotella sp.]